MLFMFGAIVQMQPTVQPSYVNQIIIRGKNVWEEDIDVEMIRRADAYNLELLRANMLGSFDFYICTGVLKGGCNAIQCFNSFNNTAFIEYVNPLLTFIHLFLGN